MTSPRSRPASPKTPKARAVGAPKAAASKPSPVPAATPKPSPASGALVAGARAPAFALASGDGAEVALADFAGEWLVVYFYPKDSTPGCTREACDFEAKRAALAKSGAAVVGVSRDSVASHARFGANQGLGFPLLSDPDAAVHRAWGAYGEKTMYGKKVVGALRTTVLVDPKGKVARVWQPVKVDGHADAVLAALGELRG